MVKAGATPEVNSGMNSQSLGFKAKQNVVQNDVMNNIFNNDSVHVKRSQASAVYKCREREDARKPGSTQNNQATSDILNQDFIAQFKEKRRRVLLEQLRNLRSKEKIGSCAIMLAQLEKLKRDVRKLTAAKLRRNHGTSKNTGQKESKSHSNSKNDEVQNTQHADYHVDNGAAPASVKDVGREMIDNLNSEKCGLDATNHKTTAKTVSYPGLHEPVDITVDSGITRNNVGDNSDNNVMSMETSDGDETAFKSALKKRDEMHDRQFSGIDPMQMHRGISSAFNQDSMKQTDIDVADYGNPKSDEQSLSTKPRLNSNQTDVDKNFIDRSKKKKPDDHVDKTSRIVSAQVSSDMHTLKPPNIILPKNSSTTCTGGKKGRQISKDTKNQENENSLLRSGTEDGECTGVKSCADIESTKRNVQDDNVPEQFDGACRPEQTDKRAARPSSVADFDFIAHQAKCEFKFKLMINSQELFPKQLSGFPAVDRKSQHKPTARHNIHKKGNHASANTSGKVITKPKDKTSRHELPINQPLQDVCQSRQSSEEQNFERQLSNVLSGLTKSQLHILQSGSPMARARSRGQPRSESSAGPVDSPNI
ncbi:Hypothetical predicted protein [Paramuricea clavata]|uniref:Uncharacterized protein n=1 Tax=Paramuricea clavata TaxID=317549 RepID=A0A6S7ILW4_PARCT|nr:Hypothetical predicted protein [Paramuricea clavata]